MFTDVYGSIVIYRMAPLRVCVEKADIPEILA